MSPKNAITRERDLGEAKSEEEHGREVGGEKLRISSNKTIRILFANIAGVPLKPRQEKDTDIQTWITNSKADIIGLAETNICWHKATGGPLKERVQYWIGESQPELKMNIHTSKGYNEIEEDANEYQIGGVAIITRGGLSCRIMDAGNDESKIGRWTWTDYRGVREIKLRVVCAYRLVHTSNKGGTETVHAQQMRALYKLGRHDLGPLEAFDKDFLSFLSTSKNDGYQIVIMMDANSNLREGDFVKKMNKAGYKDPLIAKKGNEKINSFYRGSNIIDGIFISSTLISTDGGYQSFELSPGDHRGIWMDLKAETALGDTNPILIPRRPRRLQCNQSRTVKNFNKILNEFMDKHKLGQRAEKLRQVAQAPLTTQQQKEYEQIDHLRVQGMKTAENKCRKLRMGGVQWTPQVTATSDEIKVARLLLKRGKGGKVKMSYIKRLIKKSEIDKNILNSSLSSLREIEARGQQERKIYKKNHVEKRDAWTLEQESHKYNTGKHKEAGKIRAQRNRAQMRRISSRVRTALIPFQSRGVAKIEVAGQEVTTHEGIVEGFKKEAIKRGRQTENTPFMCQPLLGEFGYQATNANAEKVLEGTYIPPKKIDPYVVKLIPHLKRPTKVDHGPQIKKYISTAEYIQAWKKKNEYTGSGPSGLHYGHFKAMVHDAKTAHFHTNMANIPMLSGYSPERWRMADDHMEQKSPTNFKADRFRPIIHVEADFNMMNGVIGRRVMDNAEHHNMIAPEQYGSRKDHAAHDQALNKRLMFDIIRQTKKPAVLIANDAKSCYDRILHIMVMLCARRTGLDMEPILSMIETIQLMAHRIHSAYGASMGYGPDDWEAPFQGMLQGNQFGPPSWAIVSSPIFDMLRSEGYGIRLCSPLSKTDIHLSGMGFVDDTDTMQNGIAPDDTSQDVLRHAQEAIDHWEGGIRATGGALDPNKTHWYLMNFTWKNGLWAYAKKDDSNKLTMLDSEGNRVTIQQQPVTKGMKTLGVTLAPDGNNQDQVEALRKKAEDWAELITTGHLQKDEAWRAMNTTILKSLEYPLAATTLTEDETTKIFMPIRKAALPKSNVARTFPKVVVHAPLKYQGLALPNLQHTQQIKHVMTLLKFGGTQTVTGNLLTQSIELMKIEVGISRPLHEIPYRRVGILATDSWIQQTWKFLTEQQMSINDEPQFMLRREGDGYLMEMLLDQDFTQARLKAVNRCRLYHKILTLSDMITGEGNKVRREIWTGKTRLEMDNRDTWPAQGLPSPADWKIWESTLQQFLDIRARDSTIAPQYQLGEGKVTDSWMWYYHQETVYEKIGPEEYKVYTQIMGRRSRRKKYQPTGTTHQKPLPSIACTTEKDGGNIIMTGTIQPEDQRQLHPPRTFDAFIGEKIRKGLNLEYYKWILQSTTPPTEEDINEIKESVEADDLIGCTDSSVKNGLSTASFMFQTQARKTLLQGEVVVPGDSSIQGSHRGEMGGAAAALTYLQLILEYKKVQKGSVEFGCDSDSVVYRGLTQTMVSRSTADHYDMVRRCHEARKDIAPVTIIPVKVKGHTDDLSRKKTHMEKLNIECDRRAGRKWKEVNKDKTLVVEKSMRGFWQLDQQGEPIVLHTAKEIRRRITEYDIFEYWTEKVYNPIRKGSWVDIDWNALEKAMRSSTQTKRQFITKHATGHCGVGTTMKKWGFRDKDNCPRCKKPHETALHVLTCKHKTAEQEWKVQLDHLKHWMEVQRTDPGITDAIQRSLKKWRKSGELYPHHYQDKIRRAIREQSKIGWDHFMLGRISERWGVAQQKYYTRIGLRKTGQGWAVKTIKEIWKMHWALWDHRNGILYKTGNNIVLDSKEMEREIKEELKQGSALLHSTEKYLFRIGMKEVLTWTAKRKKKWLSTVQAARQTSSVRHQATEQSRKTMQDWLKKGKTTE